MRFRLGLLQDTATIEKQIAKDAAEAKKPPTVKTEAQTKADEARAKEPEKPKEKKKPKIRPLTEAKAIDLGANFVSETFLLAVGIALILFENARRGRQEATKREDVADQIEELQRMNQLQRKSLLEVDKELMALHAKAGTSPGSNHFLLLKELREMEGDVDQEENTKGRGWGSWVQSLFQSKGDKADKPQPALANAPEAIEGTKAVDPAPVASTSVLSKIIPRTHPRDLNPKSPDKPIEEIERKPSNVTKGSPKDADLRSQGAR